MSLQGVQDRREPTRPGHRSPLWQQRQRSAQLLAVASKYGTFPVVLETVRECLQDTFDVTALAGLMRDLASRKIRLVEVETPAPSPFGRSLLFRYVGAFMYEGDSPLAERRAQALALDSSLLAELLGQADPRELLDPEVVEQTQNELQRLASGRACRDLEAVADLLRTIGPLSAAEIADRCTEPGAAPGGLIRSKVVNFSPVCLPSSRMTTECAPRKIERPSLAWTRRVPSSEMGGSVSTLGGFTTMGCEKTEVPRAGIDPWRTP